MSVTIKNIALYLSAKQGSSDDYQLVLSLYSADHTSSGVPLPNYRPVLIAEREVSDIDHDGWYVFSVSPEVTMSGGYYSLVLTQRSNNPFDPVDSDVNFVNWFHSSDIETERSVYSISSDSNFSAGSDASSQYTDESSSSLYGYGYGSGYVTGLDYFTVLEITGSEYGYAYDEDSSFYGYGYGFEFLDLYSDKRLMRCFKIYDEFNDIAFDSASSSIQINIPAAESDLETWDNRQDFISSEKTGIEISDSSIALKGIGKRISVADASLFDRVGNTGYETTWYESNFGLSTNDVNSADISNPSGNSNQYSTYMVAAPYYAGIYFSQNSGSKWEEKNTGLSLSDGSLRNFSSVKFGENASYIIAFDNTNSSERGKVFYSSDNGDSWSIINIADLSGIVVNDVYIQNDTTIWIGTDNGVYTSSDTGVNWAAINTGFPLSISVNQITADTDTSISYGYGYGFGEGLDYFDVLDVEGYMFGYGVDSFETIYSGAYGYGYGYEYTFTGGSLPIFFAATDDGLYRYNGHSWDQIFDDGQECFSVELANDYIYLGKENGFVRSSYTTGSPTVDFIGDDPIVDSFYPQGLLSKRTTNIIKNTTTNSEIYVSQYGGVFITKNNGGNFVSISNSLLEKRIKFILINPLNNRIIYAITENTSFSNIGLTILLDCSGSMISNDPSDIRIDMAKKIISEIDSAATTTPYFQIIKFGISERDTDRLKNIYDGMSSFDFAGAYNLTSGFTSSTTSVATLLDECKTSFADTVSHRKTSLFDSISATADGLNKYGSSWEYIEIDPDTNESTYKYKYSDIVSRYFSELDRILLIITDGSDTVLGKTISNLTAGDSPYQNMRGKIYIIGVGHNINYENLKNIKDAHSYSYLYLAPFNENLSDDYYDSIDSHAISNLDMADVVLEREQYRTRTGTWIKRKDFGEKRYIVSVNISANVPSGTSCVCSARYSDDNDTWSDWTTGIINNTTYFLGIYGRYLEIRSVLTTNSSSYGPEIRNIVIDSLDPSTSYVYYDTQTLSSGQEMSQIIFSSLDDYTLGNISSDIISSSFGVGQTSTAYYPFFQDIHREKRSIIRRKETEELTTIDNYFFTAEFGPWPGDANITVIDIENISSGSYETISSELYYTVPSLGYVIFYNKYTTTSTLKIRINYAEQYKIGLKLDNRAGSSQLFSLKEMSWMFYDEDDSTSSRSALPLVASQLGVSDVYGIVSPINHDVGSNLATTFNLQYIARDSFEGGTISIITGQRLNLQTTGSVEKWKFYEQNAFLSQPVFENSYETSYTKISGSADQSSASVSLTNSDPGIHYQIDLAISKQIKKGESVSIVIGDTSGGSPGIPTLLYQDNLLFDTTDITTGEMMTYFVAGDTDSISTIPSASLVEGAGSSTFNGFDKILFPAARLCGYSSSKLVILAPTAVSKGTTFSFIILAVDSAGLIDRNYMGAIGLSIENSDFSIISNNEYTFLSSDNGSKKFTAFVNSGASGFSRIRILISDSADEYYSNPIFVGLDENIRWGDLNVPTIFSDGRQDIDFIADYARNESLIEFVGISDDIETITEDEWDYMKYKCELESTQGLYVIPGLRYRTSYYHGERVLLFENSSTAPTDLPTKASSISSVSSQFTSLDDALFSSDYLSFPIHSSYENLISNSNFTNRGFDFEKYRDILTYGESGNAQNFVYNREIAVEVYSEHGSCENSGYIQNSNFMTDQSSAYVDYALYMGKKFAFLANSGGYSSRPGYYMGDVSDRVSLPSSSSTSRSNRGLTAIHLITPSISNLFDAIKNRRTYATTGIRPFLYTEIETKDSNGSAATAKMGEVISGLIYDSSSGNPTYSVTIKIRAVADNSTIKRIQIIKIKVDGYIDTFIDSQSTSNESFNKSDFGEDTGLLSIIDTEISSEDVVNEEYCYYTRITQADEQIMWSSPIWINFGRTEGIKSKTLASGQSIYGVSLITSGESQLFGSISGIPAIMGDVSNPIFPDNYRELMISTDGTPNATTRKTYSDKHIFVSDTKTITSGIRVYQGINISIAYGSHYLRFIYNPADYIEGGTILPGSYVNGTGPSDTSYKYLNDPNDPSIGRTKYFRNYLFGPMIQYSNSSDFMSPYSMERDTLHTAKATDEVIPLIKDPYLYTEQSTWYLFYSVFSSSYPQTSPLIAFSAATDLDSRTEEFAGLVNQNSSYPGSQAASGFPQKINFASNYGYPGERKFTKITSLPTIFDSNSKNKIAFSSSPCLVKNIAGQYKLYYLGWYDGEKDTISPTPILGMFCHSFSDLTLTSIENGSTSLCFAFTNDSAEWYGDSRDGSFSSSDFMPADCLSMNAIDSSWPTLHAAYSLPYMGLTVIQYDDGVYYAFFNYLRTPSDSNTIDSPGTGILFSIDGTTFYEYAPGSTVYSISKLPGVFWAHPFKHTIGNSNYWYMVYKNADAGYQLQYSRFNWPYQFSI